MADGRSSAGVAFNAGPVMNGRVSRVGFSASTRAGFMEAFECGKEACSAGRALMTHKYRGSIVVLSISKSVEPNEEQKEMISGFQQGILCKQQVTDSFVIR